MRATIERHLFATNLGISRSALVLVGSPESRLDNLISVVLQPPEILRFPVPDSNQGESPRHDASFGCAIHLGAGRRMGRSLAPSCFAENPRSQRFIHHYTLRKCLNRRWGELPRGATENLCTR